MKLGEQLKHILGIGSRLKSVIAAENLVGLISELCLLKLFSDEAKGGYKQTLQTLGLNPELFKESRFKGLSYEELLVILEKIKESPVLRDVFVNCEAFKEHALWREAFNEMMEAIENLDFLPVLRKDQEENTHELGEAFLELINQFKQMVRLGGMASKSLSELMTRLSDSIKAEEIYDPAIGIGTLAIQVAINQGIQTLYGQEIAEQEVRLCKILCIAYGMTESLPYIAQGDTLLNPRHVTDKKLYQFKKIVSILPFGVPVIHKEAIEKDLYGRYPESTNLRSSEMLFMHHIVESLQDEGIASVVTSNGILFRGGAEAKMRENLLKRNCIDCVIQLPAKMLADTAIATTLILMKKQRTRQDILFIDLTKEVDKISKVMTQLGQETIEKVNRLYHGYEESEISQIVPIKDILDNQSNLSVTRYVTSEAVPTVDLKEVGDTLLELEQKLMAIQAQIKEKLK